MNITQGFNEEPSEAIKLALYIRKRYLEYKENINSRIISPIKLQKSLYFLFAYWGQFIAQNQNNKDSVEVDYSNYNKYLFEDAIEAWTYGPVVPKVFHAEKEGVLDSKQMQEGINEYLEDEPIKKEFIDNLLEQLFEIDDFGLVNISHQDQCWKKHYIELDERHNREIPKQEIIDEYSKR